MPIVQHVASEGNTAGRLFSEIETDHAAVGLLHFVASDGQMSDQVFMRHVEHLVVRHRVMVEVKHLLARRAHAALRVACWVVRVVSPARGRPPRLAPMLPCACP